MDCQALGQHSLRVVQENQQLRLLQVYLHFNGLELPGQAVAQLHGLAVALSKSVFNPETYTLSYLKSHRPESEQTKLHPKVELEADGRLYRQLGLLLKAVFRKEYRFYARYRLSIREDTKAVASSPGSSMSSCSSGEEEVRPRATDKRAERADSMTLEEYLELSRVYSEGLTGAPKAEFLQLVDPAQLIFTSAGKAKRLLSLYSYCLLRVVGEVAERVLKEG